MIISHKHKFIFIRTKKVGGTSLDIALSKYCADSDILSSVVGGEKKRNELGFTGACNFNKHLSELSCKDLMSFLMMRYIDPNYCRRIITKYRNHMPATEVINYVGDNIWNNYFKFTIVRNPFDKLVSQFYFLKWFRIKYPNKKKNSQDSFAFMKYFNEINDHQAVFKIFLRDNPHLIRENWDLYSENNKVLVDDFVRFENYEVDLTRISEKIGLPENIYNVLKEINAKKNIRPKKSAYKDIIGPEERDIITYYDREEINLFKYEF